MISVILTALLAALTALGAPAAPPMPQNGTASEVLAGEVSLAPRDLQRLYATQEWAGDPTRQNWLLRCLEINGETTDTVRFTPGPVGSPGARIYIWCTGGYYTFFPADPENLSDTSRPMPSIYDGHWSGPGLPADRVKCTIREYNPYWC